ncbi:basic salivary proline-rich protein 2-like isoform X1 [Oncorhynchus nerka]|uniref:basic salivary proline-rich protein 2-like isoform X1 n=1 Tax=Oncorhynchus nerka TaxID=8023 RepID=UPI0011304205|nr:basic salivary proline-rich protein 3-like isoform X1 [Oncorhynchus nerka]XP_029528335.1 basic salivary proline-rich protein 3-like isoform X1 [Oncorhynchus nerka]XP_029528336.1 basic salivary proline-rich protein 3-like isoform X1 [Oncorhynchus nerka]
MATVLIKCTPPGEPTLHQRLNGGSVGWGSSRGVQLPVLSLRAAPAPTVCWFLWIIMQGEYIGTPAQANRRPRDPRPGKPATQGPPPRQTGEPGTPAQANRRPMDPAQANRRTRDTRPGKPANQGPPPRQTGDPWTPPRQTGDPGTPIICYEKIIIH